MRGIPADRERLGVHANRPARFHVARDLRGGAAAASAEPVHVDDEREPEQGAGHLAGKRRRAYVCRGENVGSEAVSERLKRCMAVANLGRGLACGNLWSQWEMWVDTC